MRSSPSPAVVTRKANVGLLRLTEITVCVRGEVKSMLPGSSRRPSNPTRQGNLRGRSVLSMADVVTVVPPCCGRDACWLGRAG